MIKTISDLITREEIKNWKSGEVITISAQMGKGKSYFIKNRLYEMAKEKKEEILFLVHRQRCQQQFILELEKDNKLDIIDVVTYQTLENKKDFDLSKYKYIVCDEFHYFTSDSNFNYKTDISLDKILGQNDKIRIFMSATGDLMKQYFKYIGLETIDYQINIYFDWIYNLNFFNKDETIDGIIEKVLEKQEKALVFIESSEKAYDLYKKYREHSLFCCSQSNKKYRYVDEEKIEDMLKNEKFEENLLITTTCLDAGINLRDDEIKTIICDVSDIGVLLQCLGRKRRKENEGVDVYIHNINNNILGGYKTRLNLAKKMIDDFITLKIEEFTEKYSKSKNEFYNTLFYDEGSTKKLNKLMAFKIFEQFKLIEAMIGNEDKKGYGYKNYISWNILGFNMEYASMESILIKHKLEKCLDEIIGVKLYKEERKELKKVFKRYGLNTRTLGINTLNGYLKDSNLPFIIDNPKPKSYRDENGKVKKEKTYWMVGKINYSL